MGLQTTAYGPNPARKAISSGPRGHFVNNQTIMYLQKNCWFGTMFRM